MMCQGLAACNKTPRNQKHLKTELSCKWILAGNIVQNCFNVSATAFWLGTVDLELYISAPLQFVIRRVYIAWLSTGIFIIDSRKLYEVSGNDNVET